MDTAWDHLPRASVLVYATVLAVGPSAAAHAGAPEAATEASGTDDGATAGETTGAAAPDDSELVDHVQVAPTCGPCCHGSQDPECNSFVPPPPLVPPETKKGCAVHPGAPEASGALAMLALLIALARRRED